jgi:hypothetical protein
MEEEEEEKKKKKKNAYRILFGKAKGKRPLRSPRRRWVDSIKMYRGEIKWGCMD